jgi:hypothetical protein
MTTPPRGPVDWARQQAAEREAFTAEEQRETETLKAAIARVRALHRKASHGTTCVYCAHGQRLGYDTDWPCDTVRALDQPAHNAGPTVAEAAADDRAHWTAKYAGEGQ